MLVLALVVAASAASVDAGLEAGVNITLPPAVIPHLGAFGQLRVDSLIVRVDVTGGADPGSLFFLPNLNVGFANASAVVAWSFDLPLPHMDIFVGAGPAVGLLRTNVDTIAIADPTSTPRTTRLEVAPGGVVVFGYEPHAASWATLTATMHGGLEFASHPLAVASIDGGAAFHF